MGGKKTKNDGKISAKQRRHERRISKAAERRASDTYTVPMNATVPLSSLPPAAQDKLIKAAIKSGIPADDPQPHPLRGKKLKGGALREAIERREEQARRINAKADQRRRFATLTRGAKIEHSAAGREHRRPKDFSLK